MHIPVTLTITNGTTTKPIVKTQTIAFIDKKQQTTVTFRNIQLDSTFFGSQSTTVKVKVSQMMLDPTAVGTSEVADAIVEKFGVRV